jgi:hypothetical protein
MKCNQAFGANRYAQCALHSVIVWMANPNVGVQSQSKMLQNAHRF